MTIAVQLAADEPDPQPTDLTAVDVLTNPDIPLPTRIDMVLGIDGLGDQTLPRDLQILDFTRRNQDRISVWPQVTEVLNNPDVAVNTRYGRAMRILNDELRGLASCPDWCSLCIPGDFNFEPMHITTVATVKDEIKDGSGTGKLSTHIDVQVHRFDWHQMRGTARVVLCNQGGDGDHIDLNPALAAELAAAITEAQKIADRDNAAGDA